MRGSRGASDAGPSGLYQRLGEFFPKELADIRQRRERLQQNAAKLVGECPSSRLGLVGLALSGGGIRSASFALGALQSLAQHGLLSAVDYLSTVSGGGFIGACLSSLLSGKDGPRPDFDDFPLAKPVGRSEPIALRHLRAGSNYLNPGGIFNTLRLPAVFLRGLVLNAFAILPYVLLLALLTWGVHSMATLPWLHDVFPPHSKGRRLPFLVALMLTLGLLVLASFAFLAIAFPVMRQWRRYAGLEGCWLSLPLTHPFSQALTHLESGA